MVRDRLAAFAQVVLAVTAAAVVLVAWAERRHHAAEYYALLTAAAAGMVFFVSAENLMTLFLGLEWFSLCLYVLVAIDTDRETSLEAGLKYVIVGSFGSAILLFGSAFVYGATGELGFAQIADAAAGDEAFLVAGLAMILAGLAFKVSAAPFHMWTPDVYQGAPSSVTAFMSAATKAAALVADRAAPRHGVPGRGGDLDDRGRGPRVHLARLGEPRRARAARPEAASRLLVHLARRVHAHRRRGGYERGTEALLYYLVPYSAMSVGAFAVVAARERELGRAGDARVARRASAGSGRSTAPRSGSSCSASPGSR